jgi:hypothetical protein
MIAGYTGSGGVSDLTPFRFQRTRGESNGREEAFVIKKRIGKKEGHNKQIRRSAN